MFVVKKRTSTIVCAITAPKKTAEPRTRAGKRPPGINENAAVENRRQNISGFDQIFHEGAERGHGDGHQTPARRQPLVATT